MGDTKWLSWRDISTSPTRVVEVYWLDADNQRRLTICEYERGCALHVLLGPALDDVAELTVRGDVSRFDEGQPTRYEDLDCMDGALRDALAVMHKQLALAVTS